MKLSEHPITNGMKATIHTLKARAGLDDETYRDLLFRETGHRSSTDLTALEASRVIDRLRESAGETAPAGGAVAGLDNPIGGKLRALWIAGFDLGIIAVRNDRAMLVFLERVAGVSHVRFLREPGEASKAIEGLKKWLARTANVQWPLKSDTGDLVIASKRAVLEAQWRQLIAIGEVKPKPAVDVMRDLEAYACAITRLNRWEAFAGEHYDEVQKSLGRKLRGAMGRRANH